MSKPDGEIIAHSPIVHDHGAQPCRIVIRDLGDEFVVHTQILSSVGGASFVWGHYFPKERHAQTLADSDTVALRKAWRNFEVRSRDLLGVDAS
jgi:hypothetical protein